MPENDPHHAQKNAATHIYGQCRITYRACTRLLGKHGPSMFCLHGLQRLNEVRTAQLLATTTSGRKFTCFNNHIKLKKRSVISQPVWRNLKKRTPSQLPFQWFPKPGFKAGTSHAQPFILRLLSLLLFFLPADWQDARDHVCGRAGETNVH